MKTTTSTGRPFHCLLTLSAALLSFILIFIILSNHISPSISHIFPGQCVQAEQPTIRTTFDSIPSLEDLQPEADSAWDALSTPEGGFLRVQYNETYVQSWGISMFHQLHCLGMIRATLQKKMGYVTSGYHHHGGGGGGAAEHQDDPEHVMHCFAYLAQALQCAADGTIEPPWVTHDRAGFIKADGVDGLGVVHKCRSTKPLWSAARASEKKPVHRWEWQEGDGVGDVFGTN